MIWVPGPRPREPEPGSGVEPESLPVRFRPEGAEDPPAGDQGHQGVGPVGVGRPVLPGPGGGPEDAVDLGVEGGHQFGPGHRGQDGLQPEGPVTVGVGPAATVLVQLLVVAGLLGR